ncbi:transcriptional repressor NrdR [Halovenus aranensis]|uniref:Transcriptional repressor NrdR n=2 Tax=Halovenus aranensis TaxID=890420 RepID=A0A1G8RRA9_9EURY|nr:transcriptional repressor NrdR [Halovenus aranensis]
MFLSPDTDLIQIYLCYINLIGKCLSGCLRHHMLRLRETGPIYRVIQLEGQPVTTMDCPDCGDDRTRVVDTETSADGTAVRRRRECQRCSFRFTTYERPGWDSLQVKKRDGTIEPFDRSKLRAGVERAVEKRDVSDQRVTRLVDDIESTLQDRETRIVASSLIGEYVSDRLRDVDKVAYIRFVSVYKAFSEPAEFLRELDAVLDAELEDFEPATDDSQTHEPPSHDNT